MIGDWRFYLWRNVSHDFYKSSVYVVVNKLIWIGRAIYFCGPTKETFCNSTLTNTLGMDKSSDALVCRAHSQWQIYTKSQNERSLQSSSPWPSWICLNDPVTKKEKQEKWEGKEHGKKNHEVMLLDSHSRPNQAQNHIIIYQKCPQRHLQKRCSPQI